MPAAQNLSLCGAVLWLCEIQRIFWIIQPLVGWDKETAIWWAGACELTFHFDCMLFWVR